MKSITRHRSVSSDENEIRAAAQECGGEEYVRAISGGDDFPACPTADATAGPAARSFDTNRTVEAYEDAEEFPLFV